MENCLFCKIVKGDITGFEIEANEPVVYDGEDHESATVTVGVPADAKITFAYGNKEYIDVPEFTDAGIYTVSYIISKDGYNDVTGEYTFDDLAADINNSTTVTKADAMAVLASIKPFITKALLASRRVVLNDLGAFTIGLQGKCYNRETMEGEEFRPSEYIRGHRILFRPEVKLKKDVAAGIQLKRISSEAMA